MAFGDPYPKPLTDIPEPEPGTSMPSVIATGHGVCLIYDCRGADWPNDDCWAVLEFEGCFNYLGGTPNDEAWPNHPMASVFGLFGACPSEILNSPWALERARIAHNQGDPKVFLPRMRHFLFPLKEGTFECLAKNYKILGKFQSFAAAFKRASEQVVDSEAQC